MASGQMRARYRLSDIMRAIVRDIDDDPNRTASANYVIGHIEHVRPRRSFTGLAWYLNLSVPMALGVPGYTRPESTDDYLERIAQAAVREARRLGVPMVECGP